MPARHAVLARSCRAGPTCRWGGPGTARRSGRAGTVPMVGPCHAWIGPKYRTRSAQI
uniref:Uncharacterized protein n=1 Tax=Oryza sativa subsp. japonica TaxID=39947 RepID=Q6Z5C1_ORYSJ|nr:hypothetical protein [Oryza sativa Japonica Group]